MATVAVTLHLHYRKLADIVISPSNEATNV
jgi:hypothetical protein